MWKAGMAGLDSYSIWMLKAGNHIILIDKLLTPISKVSHSITHFGVLRLQGKNRKKLPLVY